MRFSRFLPVLAVLTFAACDDKPTHVFVEFPSEAQLSGAWVGMGEITTDDDLAWNTTYGDTRGVSFPVVIQFSEDNNFTLRTSGYATSYNNEEARTCSGFFAKTNASIEFFPNSLCRALPLTQFTIGRTLPNGISLESRTGSAINSSSSFMNLRVRFRLDTN